MKKMLQLPTNRYQKLPAWLMIIIACVMVDVFINVGGTLGYLLLSGPLYLLKLFIGNGHVNIEPYLDAIEGLHVQLGLFAVIAVVNFAWVKWYEKRPIKSLGFFRKDRFLEILKGWAVGMLILSISVGVVYLFGGITLNKIDFSMSAILYVLSTIPFWFIQGGTEELLTRGWLLPIINKRSNLAIAIAISGSLFGVLHLSNDHVTIPSILCITLSGIFMALYMIKTDNLWGVAGLHGAWNFAQGNIFGVAVSGQEAGKSLLHVSGKSGVANWISGGEFGIEGSFLTCLVLLAGTFILAWQLKKEKLIFISKPNK